MSEWISIEDRLPKDTIEFVLVTRTGGVSQNSTMEANYIDGEFHIWRMGLNQVYKKPTHWMPLPEPPNLEE